MKTKVLLRAIVLALALLMLVPALAACDDKGSGGLGTTTTPQKTTTTPDTGTTYKTGTGGEILQLIPEDLNFNDTAAKLLVYSGRKTYHFPEALYEGEDIRNDIFLRNDEISQKRGLKFDVTFKSSHMSGSDIQSQQELYNEALEGKTAYEAICCYSLYPAMMALEGILLDLNSLEYPSTEMPWFPEDIQEYSIMDRLYFVANNSSITNLTTVFVIFANKTMIENKGLENIEDVVLDGRWTMDVMQTYSRNWKSEAESNPGSVYGIFFCHPRTCSEPFYYSNGFTATRRDDMGMPEYAFMTETDRALIDAFAGKLIDMMNSPECGFGAYNGATLDPLKNETAAFYVSAIEYYTQMTNEFTYSFIPFPKATEEQERYLSCRNDNFDVWCIPVYATDPEIGGVIIDDVSYSDYLTIAPKFWDMDFKYRYSDSDKGVRIFDIIRTSVKCDFGRLYRTTKDFGNPINCLANCIWENKSDPPTMANVWIQQLDKRVEKYTNALLDLKILIAQLGTESAS